MVEQGGKFMLIEVCVVVTAEILRNQAARLQAGIFVARVVDAITLQQVGIKNMLTEDFVISEPI
jgi:hypothetical protein